MNIHDAIAAAPAQPRGRWLWLAAGLLAIGAIGAVLALRSDSGPHKAGSGVATRASVALSSAAQDARRVPSIMSLTPARLAAGALGTGYAIPRAPTGPTMTSVLSAMSPETQRYTKAIMSLTFTQLAAGAGGSP
jgi:hypothetical protein